MRVSSEDGGEIRIAIEFQDGRWRWTDLTWENARRFAYGIGVNAYDVNVPEKAVETLKKYVPEIMEVEGLR